MGILFLPSLIEKKFIEISNVTLEEATEFIKNLTTRVTAHHKIKNAGTALNEPILFSGILEDLDYDLVEMEDISLVIRIANTSGTRGARAVFVDEHGTFAVGTTVIYNRNWATIGFDDNTILDALRKDNFKLTIDSPNV